MIQISLCHSDECKAELLKLGFKEETVMLRHNGVQSTDENKKALERVFFVMQNKPYQFLVADFWGVCNPD
jgi:hypothetical protein